MIIFNKITEMEQTLIACVILYAYIINKESKMKPIRTPEERIKRLEEEIEELTDQIERLDTRLSGVPEELFNNEYLSDNYP